MKSIKLGQYIRHSFKGLIDWYRLSCSYGEVRMLIKFSYRICHWFAFLLPIYVCVLVIHQSVFVLGKKNRYMFIFNVHLFMYLMVYSLHDNVLPTLQSIQWASFTQSHRNYPATASIQCLETNDHFPWPVRHICVLHWCVCCRGGKCALWFCSCSEWHLL